MAQINIFDDVDTNIIDIATNVIDITNTGTDVSTNTTAIGTNATDIGTNVTDIGTNTTDVMTNTTDIGTNTTDIGTNTTDIGTLQTNDMTQDTDITDLQDTEANQDTAILSNFTIATKSTFAITTSFADLATLTSGGGSGQVNTDFTLSTGEFAPTEDGIYAVHLLMDTTASTTFVDIHVEDVAPADVAGARVHWTQTSTKFATFNFLKSFTSTETIILRIAGDASININCELTIAKVSLDSLPI